MRIQFPDPGSEIGIFLPWIRDREKFGPHHCFFCFFFRYVIVKHVRKDHLEELPVPNRIKTYLNTPFYYSEQVMTAILFKSALPQIRLEKVEGVERVSIFKLKVKNHVQL
jgi:hypothetical protein